jgi:phage gp29-like protein
MFKLYGFRDFTIYVSRFGIPFVLAKIDEWENQQAKAVARALLASYGTDGGALVSGDVEIEAQESRRSDGRASVHLDLIRLCNAENSKAINGVTLANDNGHQGGASYALGTTHAGIRWENIVRDAVRVQAMFERDIARPFMRFNSLSGAAPVLHIQVVQALDPRQLVEIADYFVNKLGIPISVRQMRQMIGLKAPSGDEDTAGGAKGRDLARVKGAA